jgi:hypothetical protein
LAIEFPQSIEQDDRKNANRFVRDADQHQTSSYRRCGGLADEEQIKTIPRPFFGVIRMPPAIAAFA